MKYALSFILILLLNVSSFATDTKIIVRAKAKDAKFIGSSLGGAEVIIKNKMTNEILAQGKTEGLTGDTSLIMKTPLERGMSITDDKTAKFMASIDINEPTFITIEVYSTINNEKERVSASTDMWLIPGKDIIGEGVIVEIPGFLLDILEPTPSLTLSLATIKKEPIKLKAKVVMMCGCPINKNGMWNSEHIEVKALIKLNNTLLKEVPLNFVVTNIFEANLTLDKPGSYDVLIYAYDSTTGNTGVDTAQYVITK
ncbi:hypothetical protein [uncultured Formosa sp.]|uniref:hypothetical protein n=1 Tax=uncultured Formosa sp. TaxID=255435 RepID=UPI00261C652A|nr:hypothetical protein [uncultured Formosa sp.]